MAVPLAFRGSFLILGARPITAPGQGSGFHSVLQAGPVQYGSHCRPPLRSAAWYPSGVTPSSPGGCLQLAWALMESVDGCALRILHLQTLGGKPLPITGL
jgi:hypothetical protein